MNDTAILSSSSLSKKQIDEYWTFLGQAKFGMYKGEADQYSRIPAGIEPFIFPKKEWLEVRDQGSLILSAAQKVILWLRNTEHSAFAQQLFAGLKGIEASAAFGRLQPQTGIATCRLDLFFEGDDVKVIEINATIPAMQAYSDMVNKAYLNALLGKEIELEQSNSSDLLLSLLQHYEKSGGNKAKPRIGIVARKGDSQLGELLWLQKEWTRIGYETVLGHPEDIALQSRTLKIGKVDVDLVYRHIFAYRLDPDSAFANACLESTKYKIFNPISAHLEAKGIMAELSRISFDPKLSERIGLSEDEVEAVGRRVVWSRVLIPGPSNDSAGDFAKDLCDWAIHHQREVVIKSSLGYGGKGVFFGENFESPKSQDQLSDLLGLRSAMSWPEFIRFCSEKQPGQWIVQQKLNGRQMVTQYHSNDGLKSDLVYVDCSVFVNSGVDLKPKGGACRFSQEAIVNLGRGGGLIPFFFENAVSK